MSIIKALASGRWGFREEFMSALVAYLLNPGMDHGLGAKFLRTLLAGVLHEKDIPFMQHVLERIDSYETTTSEQALFSEDVLDGNGPGRIRIQIECRKAGNADIVVSIFDEVFVVIENKIRAKEYKDVQLKGEIKSLIEFLPKSPPSTIIGLYLVPDSVAMYLSDVNANFCDVTCGQHRIIYGVISWKANSELACCSMTELLSMIPKKPDTDWPSLVEFIQGDFGGYRASGIVREAPDSISVAETLFREDKSGFVGPCPLLGIIDKAWKNPSYRNEQVSILKSKPNYLFVRLADFKRVVNWALNPDENDLSNVHFANDFGLRSLYRICKYGKIGDSIYVRLKPNGILKNDRRRNKGEILKSLAREDILKLGWRELHAQSAKSSMSGTAFMKILTDKGITEYDIA